MAVDTLARTLAAGMGQNVTDVKIAMQEMEAEFETMKAMVGTPLVAATASAMTDHNKIYVYVKSPAESGYTTGHWYYWNGSAWADGGVYNSTALQTDTTLSIPGMAADAKVTGDDITDLKNANAYNIVSGLLTGTTGTHNGITYTWNENTCTVTGTASATSYNWLDSGAQNLPSGYGPGDTVYMRFQNAANGLQMSLCFYNASSGFLAENITSIEKTVTIPANAAKFRVALVCAKNVAFSSAVIITLNMVRVMNTYTNKELKAGIDSVSGDIASVETTVANLDTKITKELYNNNSYNFLDGKLSPSSASPNGITYSWSGDTCTISGTATATATNWLDTAAWNLPDGVTPGDTVYMRFQDVVNGVQMMIAFYTSAGAYISGQDQIASIEKTFTIPSTAGKWRIALICASGVSFANPVTVTIDMIRVLSAPTNKELIAGQSTLQSSINQIGYFTGSNASVNSSKIETYMSRFYDSNSAEAFAFFTDVHLANSSDTIVSSYLNVIKNTVKNTSAAYVVCGGDWLNTAHTKDFAATSLGYFSGKMNNYFPETYFPVAGNHEFNYLSGQGGTYPREDWITPEALRNLWFNRFDHCYYKFKRMTATNYVLDTEVDENTVTDYEKAMLDWFAASLISDNPAHSTVFMHIYWLGTPGSSTIPAKVLAIGKIIQAFNAHTTCTLTQATEMYAKTYDFTGTTGHIDFVMCGHSHQDFDTTIGGVPCIGVIDISNGYQNGNVPNFDMVFADYTGGKVYLTRFGNGSDRQFNI